MSLNEQLILAATITDDDIVLGSDVDLSWPQADTRYNQCTVKFNNEAENFKEDTVSWPPKTAGTVYQKAGGVSYRVATGWDSSASGAFLNNFAVWNGTADTSTMSWFIRPALTGNYQLQMTADNYGSILIDNVQVAYSDTWKSIQTRVVPLIAGTVYNLEFQGANADGIRGVAARLIAPDGSEFWTTRDITYSSVTSSAVTSTVYEQMMLEDNGVELETDFYSQGITDPYHAMAKAEETVRTSRSAFSFVFEMIIKDKYLEPGDFVKFRSERLNLGTTTDLYLRVTEVSMRDSLVCEVKATRFDWTQLAWNVKDDVYLDPEQQFSNELAAPRTLVFTEASSLILNSAGQLSWDLVDDSRVSGYILYVYAVGDFDAVGLPIFQEIGRSNTSPFSLPQLVAQTFVFGVKAYSSAGRLSNLTTTDYDAPAEVTGPTPPTAVNLVATSSSTRALVDLTWEIPALREDGSVYSDHLVATVWRSTVNDPATAEKIGENFDNVFSDTLEIYLTAYYWIRLVSARGRTGNTSVAATADFNHFGGSVTDTRPPPAPYDLVATVGFSDITLTWSNPTHNIGGGHSRSSVFGAKWIGGIEPSFLNAKLLGEPTQPNFYFNAGLSEKWSFWVKEISVGGGVSESFAGPATVETAADVTKLIELLSGEIGASQLTADLSSRIESVSNAVANKASVEQVATAKSEAIAASASVTDTISARLDTGDFSAVKVQSSASASSVTGLLAQYTVKLDVGGKVSGYGLASSSTASEFAIRADRFSIAPPASGGGSAVQIVPFVVQAAATTINGQAVPAGVYINDAYIKNGTIVAAKIGDAAITTAKIGDAQITSAKIIDASITSAKIAALSVNTINIGIDQVSIPRSAYTAAATSTNGPLQSVNIVSTGAPIFVIFSCAASIVAGSSGGSTFYIIVYRNGIEISRLVVGRTFQGNITQPAPASLTIAFTETPGAGSFTYSVDALESDITSAGSYHSYSNRSLFCLEVKR